MVRWVDQPLLVAFAVLAIGCGTVTLRSEAPDGAARVEVVDRRYPLQTDRNFEVRLESPIGGRRRTIFRSPDEGQPGHETIVWSRDSQRLLLLGKVFFADGRRLPNGDQLYLLYDLPTGKTWCNARQAGPHVARFSLDDLGDREWVDVIGGLGTRTPAEPTGVVLSVGRWLHWVQAGSSTNVKVDVENRGAEVEPLRLVIDGPAWVETEPSRISLEAGAGTVLNVHSRPPRSTYPGSFDVTVRVQGARDESEPWVSFRLIVG